MKNPSLLGFFTHIGIWIGNMLNPIHLTPKGPPGFTSLFIIYYLFVLLYKLVNSG